MALFDAWRWNEGCEVRDKLLKPADYDPPEPTKKGTLVRQRASLESELHLCLWQTLHIVQVSRSHSNEKPYPTSSQRNNIQ